MKKLMILAAVALVAVASQAAAFNWADEDVMDYAGTTLYTGLLTMYYYENGSTAEDALVATTGNMVNGAFDFDDDVDVAAGMKTYFFYTMTDTAGNIYTSEIKYKTAQKSSTATVTFSAGGSWASPEPTPEPTSAMLMLLGVAGLALKRKQK